MAPSDPTASGGTPRVFGWLYTLSVWGGTLLALAILAWLFWTLFVHTASGTSRGLAVEMSKATQTAVYAAMPSPTAGQGQLALPATCAACHTIEGTNAAGKICPDLTHIATRAQQVLASPDYTGQAKTVVEYIRESIVDPNAYIASDKPTYFTTDASGKKTSVMPAAVSQTLSDAQVQELVNYLASLE